jgi:hypothetical protein
MSNTNCLRGIGFQPMILKGVHRETGETRLRGAEFPRSHSKWRDELASSHSFFLSRNLFAARDQLEGRDKLVPRWFVLVRRSNLILEGKAGLLDFLIRQQPNHRFVMQIDDLDSVTPWIPKVTAERRDQLNLVFFR